MLRRRVRPLRTPPREPRHLRRDVLHPRPADAGDRGQARRGRRPPRGLRLLVERSCTTAAGVAAGIVLAFALARGLEALLYGTASYDLGVFAVAAAVLSAVALFASLPPTLRALRVDPSIALRAN